MPSFSAKSSDRSRNLVIVVFEGAKLMDVSGPLQVFNDARDPSGRAAYRITIVSEKGGSVATDTAIPLPSETFGAVSSQAIDTLLVAGGMGAFAAAESDKLQAFLKKTAPRCRRLGSVCLGAFVLARGGFLDGRRATTHWESCRQLGKDHTSVNVQEDAIFSVDSGVWTSAGVTAGIDMALAMLEEDYGRAEAMRLARMLVLYLKRPGGQRQFSTALQQQHESADGRFDALVAWIHSNLSTELSVATLARQAVMSERHFARVFTATMGTSPGRFVERARVEAACNAIEQGVLRLKDATRTFGFSNGERMRRAFHRHKGVSPAAYAGRFGGEHLHSDILEPDAERGGRQTEARASG